MRKNIFFKLAAICLTGAALSPLSAQTTTTPKPNIPEFPSGRQSDPCAVPVPGQKPPCPPALSKTAVVASGPVASASVAAPVEKAQALPGKVVTYTPVRAFRTYGVGFKASSLGFGGELATPLAQHFNLRLGATFFGYKTSETDSGLTYNIDLEMRGGTAQLDWFPFSNGFHVSPGILVHRNEGVANLTTVPGQRFELGDTTYTSSAADPVKGAATFAYDRQVAPMVTLGWGNIVPRSGRHWSIPVEIGAAFTDAPKFGLNLSGTICNAQGCGNIATDPQAQADMAQERKDIQNTINDYAKIYPVVSIGFAWSFGAGK